jgi:dTDP-glucose 4,6-dehydratase
VILVTGGAGFIGSNFVLDWLAVEDEPILNVDKLTYAGNLDNLESVMADPRHTFVQADVCDGVRIGSELLLRRPRAVVHFAAESHVDRSIVGPGEFVRTNMVGTYTLLQSALEYWRSLDAQAQAQFRFVHVSTDEVYGSLSSSEPPFTEVSRYQPNSPYSASKAGSDFLARAYHHTYGMPVLITNCSNNYGPYQFPEKLIPLMIHNALQGRALPIYGDGSNVRDWLYVGDHCSAVRNALRAGTPGETYNIGGNSERKNIEVVDAICRILDDLRPLPNGASYAALKSFVRDRPGHDFRYAIDASKLESELGWRPTETFESGLRRTVAWYLANQRWVDRVTTGAYQDWVEKQYCPSA